MLLHRRKERAFALRAFALVSLLAALIVFAAGCGGSGDPKPLKKPQFVAQADKICSKANEERTKTSKSAVEEATADVSEEDEAVAGTEALLSPIEEMTDELGGLGPPRGDEKEVEAIIAAFEAGSQQLEEEPGGPHSVNAYQKANELAEAYGLIDCSI